MGFVRIASAFIVLCSLALAALPVSAEPLAQACEGLVNPGFEDGFSERGAGEVSVANGWHPWWQDGPFQEEGYNRRPEYKPEELYRVGGRRIRSGAFAQKYFNTYATHNAGIYQQVNVPVGSQVTFSIWVQVWSSQYHDPATVVEPGNYRVYVGIDPTGGTDWRSANIIWSEPRMEYNTWIQLSVTAVAKAGTITVYTRGNPEFRTRFNDSYWDDACLTIIRPRPTNTPTRKPTATPTITATPAPTDTPTLTPTATDTPLPTATPTPEPALVCVRAYDDLNQNGVPDQGEALLAGAIISLADSRGEVIDKYITDGKSEPYCFTIARPGAYYLAEQNPPGYLSTSPDHWGLHVMAGGSFDIVFTDYFVPTPTPTDTSTPTPTFTSTPTLTSTPTQTAAPPTATSTKAIVPPPPAVPTPTTVSQALYGVGGILGVLLGLVAILGGRYLRARS